MLFPEYDKPVSLENFLLHYKALKPLDSLQIKELRRIAGLETKSYSEADVREEIITPLLRILGYAKETYFSLGREKPVKVAGQSKFIDYNLMLFDENFWIIEAKKPKTPKTRSSFGHKEILQALQYAAHPDINAAIIVLCDGTLIEVLDRDYSLEKPVVRIKVCDLEDEIDRLRILLSPWQNWFFQKRRLARLADKILENEYSLARANELTNLVSSRTAKMRAKILENFRAKVSHAEYHDEWITYLGNASPNELIDVWFFSTHSVSAQQVIATNLVSNITSGRTHFIFEMLPNIPRDANANFWGNTLLFLMSLESEQDHLPNLPGWLRSGQAEENLRPVIKKLIALCLTGFEAERGRQAMLLLAYAYGRLSKFLATTIPDIRSIGHAQHLLNRFESEELSWRQVTSSANDELLHYIGQCEMLLPARALKDFLSENGQRFITEAAIQHLKQCWSLERQLLNSHPEYKTLSKELPLGEIHKFETIQVCYDYLGHLALCLISKFPNWLEYTLGNHKAEVTDVAKLGSWKAQELLLMDKKNVSASDDRTLIAKRFFLGDEKLMEDIWVGYGFEFR